MRQIHAALWAVAALTTAAALIIPQPAAGQQKGKGKAEPPPMNFFVTSEGIGDGGNLGGIEGADAHCQLLASRVGAGDRTWHAYLSTQGPNAINARDRIGEGPWYSANGRMIARDLAQLHGDTLELARQGNVLHKISAVNERGEQLQGMGDPVPRHDVLTGSQLDGRAYTDGADHTCSNWTSNGAGSAQVGHFDRLGGTTTSWVSAHGTLGCSQENLIATSGEGYLYCFAVRPAR